MPTHGPSQDVQACGKEASFELLNRDADDVQAALAVIAQRPDADPTRVISTGVSAGGAASIALAARDIPGLRAIVSVAGGGEPVLAPCYIAASVPVDYGYFGSHTKIPSLWVFAKNDPLHPPGQVEVMRKAFTAGGGKLKVVELDPLDDDSHEAMGSMQGRTEWLAGADRFLRDNKLPTWQPSDVDELLHKFKWKAAGRSYLETYMSAPVQKAFAQSKKTDYGTFYAAATLEEARDKALKACEEKAPPCHIVIENFTYVGP
jgi:dienelactone hydrolase